MLLTRQHPASQPCQNMHIWNNFRQAVLMAGIAWFRNPDKGEYFCNKPSIFRHVGFKFCPSNMRLFMAGILAKTKVCAKNWRSRMIIFFCYFLSKKISLLSSLSKTSPYLIKASKYQDKGSTRPFIRISDRSLIPFKSHSFD